ncbi:hypothetical protein D3C76_399390 [compost metagenome]
MIEELAKEGHPGVEAGGQARVCRLVGDEKHRLVVGGAEHAIQAGADHRRGATVGLNRCGVVRGLVDDQVADGAGLAVDHRAGAGVGRTVGGVEQAQEGVVGSAELALPGHQVVEAAVHGAQAERHLAIGQQIDEVGALGVGFGDKDLLEDELQVRLAEIGHFNCPRCIEETSGATGSFPRPVV